MSFGSLGDLQIISEMSYTNNTETISDFKDYRETWHLDYLTKIMDSINGRYRET